MPKLTDKDLISFGIHKGKQLISVPASYLIWCFDNNKCPKDLRDYIEDNMNVLRDEIRREEMKKQNYRDRTAEERRGRDRF
jgi:uncharacterized protein (DUF3820 family)